MNYLKNYRGVPSWDKHCFHCGESEKDTVNSELYECFSGLVCGFCKHEVEIDELDTEIQHQKH